MAFDLSQFSVNRATLEVRFDFAFALWDRAGGIASDLRKIHFPNLQSKQAEPNLQVLQLAPQVQCSIQADKAFIICGAPTSNLLTLKEASAKFFPLIIERLELVDFTRIGLRIFFQRRLPTKAACAEYIIANVPYLRRKGKFFNIETNPTDPVLALRWEGPATGCLLNLNIVDAKLKLDIPFDFPTELPDELTHTAVNLDTDFYAHGLTATSKFNAPALIENWNHLIRRDIGAFING